MKVLIDFLLELSENNSKEWMDENRSYYLDMRAYWLDQVQQLLTRLSKYDPSYEHLEPKKTIFRINNNRVFHKDKPIYKDHFAFDPTPKDHPSFYLHVSPFSPFIGGGYYNPNPDILKKLRAGIDYDGDKLKKIINSQRFKKAFKGLSQDDMRLKTSPKGYSKDHRHIDLLNRKSFTTVKRLTQKEILSSEFHDIVEKAYRDMLEFNKYLTKAAEFSKDS